MARKLPKSFTSTPEEDEFFEKEKAASKADVEAVEEEAAPTEEPEEASEEATAEPEEAASEETAEEESAEESPDEEKPSRTVPIGALHEEREKRRQLQAKIEQMESTFQKMMERVGQQQPAPIAPPPAPEPQIPSYEEDPVAHLKARVDQLLQLSAGTHQQIQQQTAMQKFVDALGTLENQMRTTTPDYDAAIDFAKKSRDAELAALGYVPEARAEMMRQEILGTAAYCMQRGQNPVEAFYNYAKVRGWQGPNGTPKPAPAQAAKKLATVAKAQGAGKALPRGGSAPVAVRSLEDLATMDDKDFDKYFDSVMRKT